MNYFNHKFGKGTKKEVSGSNNLKTYHASINYIVWAFISQSFFTSSPHPSSPPLSSLPPELAPLAAESPGWTRQRQKRPAGSR